MKRWLVVAALVAAGIAPAGAALGEGRLFLAWHAPYGMPGASDTLVAACGDTSRVDTLYLSYETGRDWPTLHAITATISFHPHQGDTLGRFWDFGSGGANDHVAHIEFGKAGDSGCPGAWKTQGFTWGHFVFDRYGSRLSVIYSQASRNAEPVEAGRRYCFARLLIRPRNSDILPGCAQPVCIEWSVAALTFELGDEREVTTGDTRHASWNSPRGQVCAPYRRESAVPGKPADPQPGR